MNWKYRGFYEIVDATARDHISNHKYAGSSSDGGSATSAVKLTTSTGSATQPVYFSDGNPVKCTYTLGKSVPSNAVFTDTTYSAATTTTTGLMSAADKTKLDGIATGANKYTYTLPAASSSALGGVKIGYTASGKNYPVQLNSSNQMYVNVPWTDTNTTYDLSKYLPLTGGTMTGAIGMPNGKSITFKDSKGTALHVVSVTNDNRIKIGRSISPATWDSDDPAKTIIYNPEGSYIVFGWTDISNSTSGNVTLGTSDKKWEQIYSVKTTISNSDRNLKRCINPISEKYEEFFKKYLL